MMESFTVPQFTCFPGAALSYDADDLDLRPATGIEGGVFGRQRLPSEPIGDVALEIDNVVVGSSWRVEDTADNSLVNSGTASSTSFTVSVPYYGSSRMLRVKVRKGTSTPFYQAYETLVSVGASGASVYISQILDE